MNKKSLQFLERLCNAFGPAGFEREPIKITREYIKSYVDEITYDKLGSLVFKKMGQSRTPVVLLPGHVDEIGFVISGINESGYLTFNTLGGWFSQVLLGQRVKIRTNKGEMEGIIAAKPPHLLPREQREKVVTKDKMFIDIGCANLDEAKEMGVRIGDPAVPDSRFSLMEKVVFKEGKKKGKVKLAIGKAFDDRIGVFVAAEVIRILFEERIEHPNTVLGAATTQEEVGLRGARTTAYVAKPDVCITLEVDISGDVPGIKPHQAPAKMGRGPSILTFDATMIPNQPLKETVIGVAEENKIPYQLSQTSRGGTDAGAIHIHGVGCPSLVVGVPTRHIHSHAGILSLEDVENCIKLIIEVVKKLDEKTVDEFTSI
ncbi:M42 family peptidase [Candidatus Aerophobetes bacterium]|uniref:M42 family peptidase n=1 Tax=Aerophobetes bacterium TaxID=2030807 RepID=A0A523TKE4_UNCAE|nr:MAG: M42 family peptidase [Candidatus Aerophobetes bacterium]